MCISFLFKPTAMPWSDLTNNAASTPVPLSGGCLPSRRAQGQLTTVQQAGGQECDRPMDGSWVLAL